MDAKSQVEAFERVIEKIFQAYRIKLNLMARRNQILSSIVQNKGVISEEFKSSLLNVLEKEKKVISIILNEDEAGRNNMDIALYTLKKVRVESSISVELRKRGIGYSDLEKATEVGLDILNKMSKRLRQVEERIVVEEKLIANPTPKRLEGYLYLWHDEIRQEERFRKFIIKQPVKSFHPMTTIGILGIVASFAEMFANRYFMSVPSPIPDLAVVLPSAIGVGLIAQRIVLAFIQMIKENQKYLDFQGEGIIKALKSYQLKPA